MDWEELQKKHFEEWKELEKSSEQEWNKMHEKHVEIKNMFKKDPDRIPQETMDLIWAEKAKYTEEWGKGGSNRMRLIFRQQRDLEVLIKLHEYARRVFLFNDRNQKTKDHSR